MSVKRESNLLKGDFMQNAEINTWYRFFLDKTSQYMVELKYP